MVNTAAIEKMLLPLKGLLSQTDVQFGGFGEVLEAAARLAIAADADTVEGVPMPTRLQFDSLDSEMADKELKEE